MKEEADVLVAAVDFEFDAVCFDVFVGFGEFVYLRAGLKTLPPTVVLSAK